MTEGLAGDLERLRGLHRGDIVRAAAKFSCLEPACAVNSLIVHFATDKRRPFQLPLMCPRCRAALTYVRLEVGP